VSGVPPVIVFDVFRTLVAFDGDHVSQETWSWLSAWLGYRGVALAPEALRSGWTTSTQRRLGLEASETPDVDVREVWHDVLGDLVPDLARREPLVSGVALEWRQQTTRSITLWPGTVTMLDAARDAGARLGIASNTQRAYTAAELAMLGIADRFEVVTFSSDVRACKPDPAALLRTCALMDVGPGDVAYVGDNPLDDVEAARAAGAASVLLQRGTVPAAPARGQPDVSVDDGDGPSAVAAALALLGGSA